MPVPTAWQSCPKQSCVHSPGTGSLFTPASLACANAWAVRLPNAGAQCIPASWRSCVWPDVCAHCYACKESAKQVRWLVQVCCNSEFSAVLRPGQSSLRVTCHHNSKWPECKCAPAILNSTSCISQTWLRPANRLAFPASPNAPRRSHTHVFNKCPFHLSSSYVQELKKKAFNFATRTLFDYRQAPSCSTWCS